MRMLVTIAAPMLLITACQKDTKDSGKDDLSATATIVVPNEETSSARGQQANKYNTFYGPTEQFGEGRVRSWVNISHDNKPLAIGMEFTEGVLVQEHSHSSGDDHGHEVLLKLHQKAKAVMPFDHLTMGFMAEGHPPPGIYTKPHFDFHFYKMPLAERLAIPAYELAKPAFDKNPPAGYLPPAYGKAPAGEARMGAHWMDVLSPEFNGQPFTHTFVYGSYDGEVNFLEPMASLAFLQEGTSVHKPFRQPEKFDPVNTYYPTRYNIWKDPQNGRHYIALDQMVLR
ncbi:hypothetical protein [Paracnuella aquatica]|uniref:hypothetical protein n=1 Tax=Paracnuella aquatica TaxID=2268757 RepID=UPI000F4E200C|nr:hypothetical protein [Paracnuella aquatica]RPD51969.1 hypothetical protein DRJ53_04640 [Paracnuella aquatica]